MTTYRIDPKTGEHIRTDTPGMYALRRPRKTYRYEKCSRCGGFPQVHGVGGGMLAHPFKTGGITAD